MGLAVGDALGAKFEGQEGEYIRERFPTVQHLLDYPLDGMWYTDDTQMAIGVAETLVEHRQIREDALCRAFVENYQPNRGYGRGARGVLSAMEDGKDYRQVAENFFPGGSYGNGAAMRVAPVGLFYRDDVPQLLEQARLSALPTHLHPWGIEGAQLIALAVGLASHSDTFTPESFFSQLLQHSTSPEYQQKLTLASLMTSASELLPLGNGIAALESAPTAVASFALHSHSYALTIGHLILLGGDTDTMAAMAGAISGALLGIAAIPKVWLQELEDSPKGRDYIDQLAHRLYEAHLASM